MKVLIDWDERYPDLFLSFDEEEELTSVRETVRKHGVDVPDELAQRWRDVRNAWRALDDEVRQYTGRTDW